MNRREAVAQALALIADDLAARVRPDGPHQAEPRQPQVPASLDPRRRPSGPRSTPSSPPARASHRRRGGERRHGRLRTLRLPPRGRESSRPVPRPQSRGDPLGTARPDRRRRRSAGRPALPNDRRLALPRLARPRQDARDLGRDPQPQEHAFQHPPRRPGDDARPRRRRQRLHRLEEAGRRASSSKTTSRSMSSPG